MPMAEAIRYGVPGTTQGVNAITGGAPVPFRNGRVDLSQWSVANVPVKITGNNELDKNSADAVLAEYWGVAAKDVSWLRKEYGYILHHDSEMQLVPGALNGVPHVGTAADARAGE